MASADIKLDPDSLTFSPLNYEGNMSEDSKPNAWGDPRQTEILSSLHHDPVIRLPYVTNRKETQKRPIT